METKETQYVDEMQRRLLTLGGQAGRLQGWFESTLSHRSLEQLKQLELPVAEIKHMLAECVDRLDCAQQTLETAITMKKENEGESL